MQGDSLQTAADSSAQTAGRAVLRVVVLVELISGGDMSIAEPISSGVKVHGSVGTARPLRE